MLRGRRFWADHSRYVLELQTAQDRAASLRTRLELGTRELERLRKTDVYSALTARWLPLTSVADAFCIGHDGGLATINGLRLGRLPNVPVDWPEINAAWGHTLLLLVTLARRSGLTFETYRPIPLASASKIERIPDKAVVELYGSGDFVFGRLFHNRRFDSAMVAFLDCLRQLMQHALKADPSLRLPFACVSSRY